MIATSDLPQFKYKARDFRVSDSVKQKSVRFQPMTSYGSSGSSPNNYITFNFKSDGYWDPNSTYINIEIDADTMPDQCIYQLDGSAQSIIGQYIARINGVELIRMREYDEMASFMYDLNLSAEARDSKAGEGLGRNKSTSNSTTTKGANAAYTWPYTGITTGVHSWNTASTNIKTTSPLQIGFGMTNAGFKPWSIWQGGELDQTKSSDLNKAPLGASASYLECFSGDDSQGVEMLELDSSNTTVLYSNFGGLYLRCKEWGFPRTNTEACVGTGEYYFSKTFYKNSIQNGYPAMVQTTKANFQIPLLCPVFGGLATHGKLLPMELFDSLEFEFLINPYAFFTGGTTSDASLYLAQNNENDLVLTWNAAFAQKSRLGWRITRFEICTELYYPAPREDSLIKTRIESTGFSVDFKSWYLGPKIKYTDGEGLNSTVQINNGFDSLNLLAFYFQPADYENYSFTRKHKRISNNLTSMQLRFGSDYIPSIPICGHAGNLKPSQDSLSTSLVSSYGRTNYVEFYVSTMKAFGKWLNLNGNGIINATNYTLNTVGYDPSENITGLSRLSSLSYDCSLFWENQIVPRCIFAFDLERFDAIEGLKSGLNTTKTRPFDLLLSNENGSHTWPSLSPIVLGNTPTTSITPSVTLASSAFPRPLYLYIWMYYDAMISYSAMEGWTTKGRV